MTATAMTPDVLTPRWHALRPHAEQARIWTDAARFKVIVAGARSGKSENVKRWAIVQAMQHPIKHPDNPLGRYLFGGPTQGQAFDLFFDELEAFIPAWALDGKPRRSPWPEFRLKTGTIIRVAGLDEARRMEGRPWDGIVVDEFSECKPDVMRYLRPMLSTEGREGWLVLLSRPRGARHMKKLYDEAPMKDDWLALHWTSESILTPEEIASAKQDMDELEYRSEYLAEFVTYAGRAYHQFDRTVHVVKSLPYNPAGDLLVMLDFNQAPGIAVLGQEKGDATHLIGEVYIPRGSTTPAVCEKLIHDWRKHTGRVIVYGDATGGQGGSAKVLGDDWRIVKEMLRKAFPGRVFFRVPPSNPRERARLNATNARLRSADGKIHLLIDGNRAKHVPDDFEETMLLEGGVGKVDKNSDLTVSHMTDAIGYYVAREFPVGGKPVMREVVY